MNSLGKTRCLVSRCEQEATRQEGQFTLCPGHGLEVDQCVEKVDEYIANRKSRIDKVCGTRDWMRLTDSVLPFDLNLPDLNSWKPTFFSCQCGTTPNYFGIFCLVFFLCLQDICVIRKTLSAEMPCSFSGVFNLLIAEGRTIILWCAFWPVCFHHGIKSSQFLRFSWSRPTELVHRFFVLISHRINISYL